MNPEKRTLSTVPVRGLSKAELATAMRLIEKAEQARAIHHQKAVDNVKEQLSNPETLTGYVHSEEQKKFEKEQAALAKQTNDLLMGIGEVKKEASNGKTALLGALEQNREEQKGLMQDIHLLGSEASGERTALLDALEQSHKEQVSLERRIHQAGKELDKKFEEFEKQLPSEKSPTKGPPEWLTPMHFNKRIVGDTAQYETFREGLKPSEVPGQIIWNKEVVDGVPENVILAIKNNKFSVKDEDAIAHAEKVYSVLERLDPKYARAAKEQFEAKIQQKMGSREPISTSPTSTTPLSPPQTPSAEGVYSQEDLKPIAQSNFEKLLSPKTIGTGLTRKPKQKAKSKAKKTPRLTTPGQAFDDLLRNIDAIHGGNKSKRIKNETEALAQLLVRTGDLPEAHYIKILRMLSSV